LSIEELSSLKSQLNGLDILSVIIQFANRILSIIRVGIFHGCLASFQISGFPSP